MKFASKGNSKVGSKCVVTSRAVGDSCPSSCEFLDNGCYAQHTERQYPRVRPAWVENLIQPWNQIRSMLLFALKNEKDVRLHAAGDFFLNGKLDTVYLANLTRAITSLRDEGKSVPRIWTYTHVYMKEIADLVKYGVNVYASVHNAKDMADARKAGFTKFAYVDTAHRFTSKKRKGGSPKAPKYVTFNRKRFLVCPEQRLGRGRVTCTGGNGSTACLWCVKSSGQNVAFIEH